MDLYLRTSQASSQLFTNAYSSSFGLASRLFSKQVRVHIYTIYGLTRIADEIVDTYKGPQAREILNQLEAETYQAIKRGYSANPIIHAFQATANQFGITKTLLQPFFQSMRSDLTIKKLDQAEYETYIYGSAEVVGLMCLRVFCSGRDAQYNRLKAGAAKLGSAYQKVNFLRDLHADHAELGRCYFPGVTFKTLDEAAKKTITQDIRADFAEALPAIQKLPAGSKRAVMASYRYYMALLTKLEATPIEIIKKRRIRINNARKVMLLI